MSKLGYFLGGALAGVIGTAVAAYVADACSSSGTDASEESDMDMAESTKEADETVKAESFAEAAGEEAAPA